MMQTSDGLSKLHGPKGDKIRKEILLVDKADGELTRFFPRLRELAFNITHLDEPDWIPRVIKGSSPFAMVAVNGPVSSTTQGERIIQTIQNHEPDMPLLWLTDQDRNVPSVDGREPDAVIVGPSNPQTVSSEVYKLLEQRFFPEFLTNIFVQSVSQAMRESFATELTSVSQYLRADAKALGPISAMVTFAGRGCDGCITISGPSEFFKNSHQRLLPGSKSPKVSEIAGETCNVITGRFKSELLQFGLELRHSFPIIVEAHPLSLSYGGPGRLGLVETLTDGNGAISVELCLDVFDRSLVRVDGAIEAMSSGHLHFL